LKELSENVHDIKVNSDGARALIAAINPDNVSGVNTAIEGHSDLIMKVRTAAAALKELENELTAGEADYYRIIAELLIDALKQMAWFDVYASIPHVKLLNEKLRAIQSEIKRQVQWSFREIGQLVSAESNGYEDVEAYGPGDQDQDLSSLNRIYIVVDALGLHFRKDLLDRFAQLQLIPYEKLFAAGTKLSALENLDKRFAWFKKLLSAADHRLGSYIPFRWGLPYHLFAEFVRRTKKHLTDVMSAMEKGYTDKQAYVPLLLKAVRAATVFEAEMKASFTVAARGQDDFEEHIVVSSPTKSSAPATNNDYLQLMVSSDFIATAFDGFLGPYVQQEREELDKLMARIIREEDAGTLVEEDGPRKAKDPFTSAKKMFDYIKKSLNRCTGYSTGFTYISLQREFCISLHHYAETLKFRCPSPSPSAKPGKPPVYVTNAETESLMFTVINTAEYCSDILPGLDVIMKRNVQPSHIDEVDFSHQVESFSETVSYTLNILCKGVIERLDGAFRKLRQTNWAIVEEVGDDSPYCKEIYSGLSEVVARARNALSMVYFQMFTKKLAITVLETLHDSIWKLKKIAKTGAGQLLLDLNGIKEYLLIMPNKRLEPGKERVSISQSYTEAIHEKIQSIKVILKLVCTDDDKLNETFADLWPGGTQADLDAIVALKAKTGLLAPVSDVFDGAMGVVGTAKTAVDGAVSAVGGMGNATVGAAAKTAVGGAKTAVGGAKNAVGGAVGGAKSVMGQAATGITSAFGDFSNVFTGKIGDESTHSHSSNSSHGTGTATGGGNARASTGASKDSLHKKGVLTGVGAAFGFSNTTHANGSAAKK
jgi:hypothetical protein